ncbi:flippase [Halorubrum lipolyticum]|uniref:Polysaccharide biosynthesis protein n=1 Tax=Halorubrum lipolyticum DSM 21995 TaxID=1227482 RepID=M0NWE3_9EURY|nr:flippase [Halorubrum lipolyticum]EMA61883.1 polysaccharide biosynthesis protein [Halorubrum lipolyticum DSM 21995]
MTHGRAPDVTVDAAESQSGPNPSTEVREDTTDTSMPPSNVGDQTMAEQGGVTFAGELIKKGFGFLVVAVITRLVSPGVYGLFVLSTSVLHLTQVFASAGLHRAIDYFVPQYLDRGEPGRARGLTIQVFGLLLLTSTVTGIGVFVAADALAAAFDEPGVATGLRMLSVALPLLAVFNGLMASYSGIKRLRYRVYVRDITRPTVRLLATVGLLLVGFGLVGIVGGYVIGLVLGILLGVVLLTRRNVLKGGETVFTSLREILWYGVPLALAGVIFVVMGQVDYFVVGYFMSSDDVGIYRIGYMLAANLLVFFSSLAPVFKPLIAERRRDGDAIAERYQTATRWVLALSLPAAAVLVLGADAYLSLVFTPQYTAASGVVLALIVGYLVSVTAGGPDGALLQGLGYSRLVFLNSALLLVANLVFSVLLVPRYGILGAGLGTMLALTLSGVAALLEVYHYRGIHPFTRELGLVVAAWLPALATGALVVTLVSSDLVVAVVLPLVVVGTYALAGRSLGVVTPADVEIAEHVVPQSVVDRVRRASEP